MIVVLSIALSPSENYDYKRTHNHFSKWCVSKVFQSSSLGHSQPRVIIYTNVVDLESPIPHAKLEDYQTSAS